jgi:hypothetical protein
VASSSITFIPNSVKTDQLIQKLKRGGWKTHRQFDLTSLPFSFRKESRLKCINYLSQEATYFYLDSHRSILKEIKETHLNFTPCILRNGGVLTMCTLRSHDNISPTLALSYLLSSLIYFTCVSLFPAFISGILLHFPMYYSVAITKRGFMCMTRET